MFICDTFPKIGYDMSITDFWRYNYECRTINSVTGIYVIFKVRKSIFI